MLNYTKCLKTDDKFNDDYTLHYNDALIQAEYKKEFQPTDSKVFGDISIGYQPKKIVHKLQELSPTMPKLGEHLGFSNLWIAFHGYWPEKGGLCPTGSFKDMEAVPTLQRMKTTLAKG